MGSKLVRADGKFVERTVDLTGLIDSLYDTYDEFRVGVLSHTDAVTRAKIANSIIAAVRTEIIRDRLASGTSSRKSLDE